MSTYKIDLPFHKSVYGQKTLSYLGPKTWNSLPAQIKLCKNVNTFKYDIKNLFLKRLQKRDDGFSCRLISAEEKNAFLFFHSFHSFSQRKATNFYSAKRSHITFCLLIIFVIMCSVYLCSSYSPRDHNENKVNPDLYYVIPVTLYS